MDACLLAAGDDPGQWFTQALCRAARNRPIEPTQSDSDSRMISLGKWPLQA